MKQQKANGKKRFEVREALHSNIGGMFIHVLAVISEAVDELKIVNFTHKISDQQT